MSTNRFFTIFSLILLVFGEATHLAAQPPAVFAGTGNGTEADGTAPIESVRFTKSDRSTQRQRQPLSLGNPFGVEVIGDDVWITTVDDQCIWKTSLTSPKITRVAGNGRKGYSGDGGLATDAAFNWPHEVRVGPHGSIYIADTRNHAIRKVDAKTNVVSTVAGNGSPGFAGEGKSKQEVQFDQPHSVVLDGEDGLLVADTKNHRLRRIDLASGVVKTIAGNGKRKLPKDGQPAKHSPLFGPRSLAVDANSIWIALREGNSVWRIDRKSNTIHHVAGTGKKGYTGDGGDPATATFSGPKGVAIDGHGNLLVVDTENHAVRRIDFSTNTISTVLGGTSSKATLPLKRPHGIGCIDDSARFLVGDSEFHRVIEHR